MPKTSAGLLMYRYCNSVLEVFLVHPGGPFWARKDMGAWSIPKGLYDPDEDPLDAARREFEEETGFTAGGNFKPLGAIRQPSGKIITAWAVEGDADPSAIKSNMFTMEWPPKSGRQNEFPEVDRAAWFTMDIARGKIHKGQVGFIDALERLLNIESDATDKKLNTWRHS